MRRNSSNGLDFRESRRVRGSGVRQVAEREGFEPPVGCPTHAFQACALDHSATSPKLVIPLSLAARPWSEDEGTEKGSEFAEVNGENRQISWGASICRLVAISPGNAACARTDATASFSPFTTTTHDHRASAQRSHDDGNF